MTCTHLLEIGSRKEFSIEILQFQTNFGETQF